MAVEMLNLNRPVGGIATPAASLTGILFWGWHMTLIAAPAKVRGGTDEEM